ncbi:MAG: 30S ribosomal protein S17 [Mycoplasma sp.]|nr:30S ribosomal protein S17 [Mycoplasma sp.]
MERLTSRKTLTGVVVSTKNEKTIVVSVETYKVHPLYKKRFKSTKKYQAHDEKNEAGLGDVVLLAETKPYSKTKKFRLVKISKKAGEK